MMEITISAICREMEFQILFLEMKDNGLIAVQECIWEMSMQIILH